RPLLRAPLVAGRTPAGTPPRPPGARGRARRGAGGGAAPALSRVAAAERGVRAPAAGRRHPLRPALLARAARAAARALPEPVRQSHLAGPVPVLSPVGELQRERPLRGDRAAPLRAGGAPLPPRAGVAGPRARRARADRRGDGVPSPGARLAERPSGSRSEERRVGKVCSEQW